MKEKILELRKSGHTYNEIVKQIGCAKSSVSYHCSDKVKQKYKDYRNKNRKKSIKDLKSQFGGKCFVCGYDRCLTSLSFHHKNPKIKLGSVGRLIYDKGKRAAILEAKKCILVCANCHGEIHEGIIHI